MKLEGNRMAIFLIITVGIPFAVGFLDIHMTHETLLTVFLVMTPLYAWGALDKRIHGDENGLQQACGVMGVLCGSGAFLFLVK